MAVVFLLDDPVGVKQKKPRVKVQASVGDCLLEVALDQGIEIPHACGGSCACTTCHLYVEEGSEHLAPMRGDEQHQIRAAFRVKPESRLSCQAMIEGDGPIVVRVPL